jgi:hypothetical protein
MSVVGHHNGYAEVKDQQRLLFTFYKWEHQQRRVDSKTNRSELSEGSIKGYIRYGNLNIQTFLFPYFFNLKCHSC